MSAALECENQMTAGNTGDDYLRKCFSKDKKVNSGNFLYYLCVLQKTDVEQSENLQTAPADKGCKHIRHCKGHMYVSEITTIA